MATPWANEHSSEPAGSNGSTGSASGSPRRSSPVDGSPVPHPQSTTHVYSTISPHHSHTPPMQPMTENVQESIQPEHRRPSVLVAAPSADPSSYTPSMEPASTLLSRASAAAGLDTMTAYSLTQVTPDEMQQSMEMYGSYNPSSYYGTNSTASYSTPYSAELLRSQTGQQASSYNVLQPVSYGTTNDGRGGIMPQVQVNQTATYWASPYDAYGRSGQAYYQTPTATAGNGFCSSRSGMMSGYPFTTASTDMSWAASSTPAFSADSSLHSVVRNATMPRQMVNYGGAFRI